MMFTKSRFFALTAIFSLLLISSALLISSVNARVLDDRVLDDNGSRPEGARAVSEVYDSGFVSPNHLVSNRDFAVFTASNFDASPGPGYVLEVGLGDSLYLPGMSKTAQLELCIFPNETIALPTRR